MLAQSPVLMLVVVVLVLMLAVVAAAVLLVVAALLVTAVLEVQLVEKGFFLGCLTHTHFAFNVFRCSHHPGERQNAEYTV